jgi:hypothetical protein
MRKENTNSNKNQSELLKMVKIKIKTINNKIDKKNEIQKKKIIA